MTFRIIKFLNKGIDSLQVEFSEDIDDRVSIGNVTIVSNIANVGDLTVLSVEIDGTIITITTSPQFPLALYTLTFISTDDQNFSSVNGDILQSDNFSSSIQFVGLEKENEIRTNMLDGLSSVYNTESDTLIRKHISNVADVVLRANVDIKETGNSNYISVDVVDEVKTRGIGPFDRLDHESAYKVVRVATTPTGANFVRSIDFNADRLTALMGNDAENANEIIASFSADPISLKVVYVVGEIISNRESIQNSFDGITLSLSKSNVAQLLSCVLERDDGSEIIYNLPEFGYAILDNRYDTTHGSKLLTLESNQFRLNETAIFDGYFQLPEANDRFRVSYAYINNGLNIDGDTLEITQIKEKIREAVGGFLTVFYLSGFPIVDESGTEITSGGVDFLDPDPSADVPFISTHPAFLTEITFDGNRLPSQPGEFAIDYETGQVFVYGESTANGTGSIPPVASYHYLKTFISGIDYDFDADTDEVSGNVTRDLIGQETNVQFEYEEVLAPETDFIPLAHIEIISEQVENRLSGAFKISTKNSSITNVFRVSNDTTGELYSITGFNDNFISFAGREAPRVISKENEPVVFARVFNEPLAESEIVIDGVDTKIIKIELQNNKLTANTIDGIGSNVNSTIIFTQPTLFVREFFYDDVLQSVSHNISKLSAIGDYLVNYSAGIIYLYAASDTDDFGEINYSHGQIDTLHLNIISPDRLAYKSDVAADDLLQVTTPTFTFEVIETDGLLSKPERFLLEDTDKPIILGGKQYGVAGQRTVNSVIFVALDAQFESDHADGNHFIRFTDDVDREIVSFISTTSVELDIPFTDSDKFISWVLVDFDFSDGYTAITSYDIQSIRAVYSVPDLQSLDRDTLVNLYDASVDTIEANVITFNNDNIKAIPPGTALAIDYDFGNLYVDYTYLKDNISVSYEYGDNSLDFSISSALTAGDQYFVSYSYGALREGLLTNFGTLTQIPELSVFPLEFDRELYRSGVAGALQAFSKGPIVEAIEVAVSSITEVSPNITELTFNEWTADRDNLHLSDGVLTGAETYTDGKYDFGIVIDNSTTLEYDANAYLSLREGTAEAWVRPQWRGIDNDATLTFDIGQDNESADGYDGYGITDGYRIALEDIFIGASAFNPTVMPFSIHRDDAEPFSPNGKPFNFGTAPGYFIWYDEDLNEWMIRVVADPINPVNFTGTITTSGQFYNVTDGYENDTLIFVNEGLDSITSTNDYVKFSLLIDGYEAGSSDGYVGFDGYDGYSYISDSTDGYLYQDGINFTSDDVHFLFDTGAATNHNRLSVFKDGAGYLNFKVWDLSGAISSLRSREYGISSNIQDWLADEQHHIATSWRLNSADGIDELHLFVDGQEVSNNFKWGGRPEVSTNDIYRTVADEVLVASAAKTVVGAADGISTAGSATFTSTSSTFISDGIIAGDSFNILDATADGLGSPYVIAVVASETTLQLTTPLLLSLSNVGFSVNQLSVTTQTMLDAEIFAVFVTDAEDTTTELNGLDAETPDYTIEKSGADDVIKINNGIAAGDRVFINTLGLTRGRAREVVYKYVIDNDLYTNLPPPFAIEDVNIFKIIGKAASIIDDGEFNPGDGYGDGSWSLAGVQLTGTFTNLSQPSNQVVGKKLNFTLGGVSNINFSGTNQITVTGTSSGGPAVEVISFTEYGTETSTTLWTGLTSFACIFTGFDIAISFGSLEIMETFPLTESEAGGNYASVANFENGNFVLHIFGSGGLDFTLNPSYYLVDYPIKLTISLNQKGKLMIGSNIDGSNQWDGTIDDFVMLNEMLMDVRVGETPSADQRSVTSDFNSLTAAGATAQTTMLLHFNQSLNNIDTMYTTYDGNVQTSSISVNSVFGDCAVFFGSEPQRIDNADTIIGNSTGTIEFWISPFIDTLNDQEQPRYYIDVSAAAEENVISSTVTRVTTQRRAKSIISVRLASDDGTGVDFFDGGSLNIDGRTITLGTRLPTANTNLKVRFVSVDQSGDRLSIYKDGYGSLNFEILASNDVFQISYPIVWSRNTWHRVMASWNLNNTDNNDRMRLFVDGVEGGSIVYGSPGLIYGIGIVYGVSAVGSLGADFLTTNIDFTDSFSEIVVGNSWNGGNPCKAKIDNLRFSSNVRQPAIVADVAVDLNYSVNLEAVLPVIEDDFTTAIFDYDKDATETEFLSNLLSETTPLFLFDVEVVDSFEKLTGNERAKQLIRDLIDRIRPAHTQAYVTFTE